MDVHPPRLPVLLMLILLSPVVAGSFSSSSANTFSRRLLKAEVLSTTTFAKDTDSSMNGTMITACVVLPRGGGHMSVGSTNGSADDGVDTKKGRFDQGSKKLTRARYKLVGVARHLIRTATKLWRTDPYQQTRDCDDGIDHSFDELDRIFDDTAICPGNEERVQQQQQDVANKNAAWHEAWPPLPQAASLLKGRKERSLRAWINKVHLSTDTAKAIETIRSIIHAFPNYGVVDLVGMHR